MSDLSTEILFKCRLIVGRYGEMDLAGWWNTSGILSQLGSKVASRGLPRTEFYGRARALFAVASQRTQQYFAPPDSFTLWSLPPSVENALDEAMIQWAHEGRVWSEVVGALAGLKAGELLQALGTAGVAADQTVSEIEKLKAGPEGKTVRLPAIGNLTDETIKILAASFLRSNRDSLLLPVAPIKGGLPE